MLGGYQICSGYSELNYNIIEFNLARCNILQNFSQFDVTGCNLDTKNYNFNQTAEIGYSIKLNSINENGPMNNFKQDNIYQENYQDMWYNNSENYFYMGLYIKNYQWNENSNAFLMFHKLKILMFSHKIRT